ncbi:hypothetical protein M758_7G053300 [Ceratodon purpureus]|uniref:Uncharacterized protein n=1 Tax=Ceratodon purpureus TaxID=3225 RepID=A0A8T0H6D9_CERPU|nr:hypothetical protein KC19_7G055800 [Ceratodon purpureus]KAG0610281.1 hypothetical protein M758_7G053300 [Ceratodon purpureus]
MGASGGPPGMMHNGWCWPVGYGDLFSESSMLAVGVCWIQVARVAFSMQLWEIFILVLRPLRGDFTSLVFTKEEEVGGCR